MREKLQYAFEAVGQALDRAGRTPPDRQFVPLAEALLWLTILNDIFWDADGQRYRDARDADSSGRTIEGLRYARHRLVHDIDVTGMHGLTMHRGVLSRDSVFAIDSTMNDDHTVWCWRSIEGLPPANDRGSEDTYVDGLVGRSVVLSIRSAFGFLARYRDEVEDIAGPHDG